MSTKGTDISEELKKASQTGQFSRRRLSEISVVDSKPELQRSPSEPLVQRKLESNPLMQSVAIPSVTLSLTPADKFCVQFADKQEVVDNFHRNIKQISPKQEYQFNKGLKERLATLLTAIEDQKDKKPESILPVLHAIGAMVVLPIRFLRSSAQSQEVQYGIEEILVEAESIFDSYGSRECLDKIKDDFYKLLSIFCPGLNEIKKIKESLAELESRFLKRILEDLSQSIAKLDEEISHLDEKELKQQNGSVPSLQRRTLETAKQDLIALNKKFTVLLTEKPEVGSGEMAEFRQKVRDLRVLAKQTAELPFVEEKFRDIRRYKLVLNAVAASIEWDSEISKLEEKIKKQYENGHVITDFNKGIGQYLSEIISCLEKLRVDYEKSGQNERDPSVIQLYKASLQKIIEVNNFLGVEGAVEYVSDDLKFSGIRSYAQKLALVYKDIPWDKLISALEAEIKASHSKEDWDVKIRQAVLHLEKLRKSLDNRTDMNDADSQEDCSTVAIAVGELLVFRNSLQADLHTMKQALESMQLELRKLVKFLKSNNDTPLFLKGIEETLLQLLVQPERQMSAGNVALLTTYLQNLLLMMQNRQQNSKSILGILDAVKDILIFRAKLLNAEAVSECNLIAEVLLKARNISENYRAYEFLASIEKHLWVLLLDPKMSVSEVANGISEQLMVVEKELAEKLYQDLEQSLNLYAKSLNALSVPGLWDQSINYLFSDLKKVYVGVQLNLKAVEVKISLGALKDSLERHENPPFSVIIAMIDILAFRMALLSQDEQDLETIKNLLMQVLGVYKEKTNVARLKEFEDCLFELLNESRLEEITIQLINKKLEGLVAIQKENRKKAVNALKEDLHNKVYYNEDKYESESPDETGSSDETKFTNRILAQFFDLIDWEHTQEERLLMFGMTDVFLRWFPKAIDFAKSWIEPDFLEPLEAYKIAVEKNEEKIDLLVKIFKIVNTKLSFLDLIETNRWDLAEKTREIKSLLDKVFELNKILKIDEKVLENIISRIKLLLLMSVVNEEAIAACAKELKEIVSEVVITSEKQMEESVQILEEGIAQKEKELSFIEYTITELKQDKSALERDVAAETQALEELTLEHNKSSAEQAQKLKFLKQDKEQKEAALLEKKEELIGVEKRISDEMSAVKLKELEISRQKGKDKTTLEEISNNDKLIKDLERPYQELQEKQAEKQRAFVAAEAALDKQIKEMRALKEVMESTQEKLDTNYEKAAKSEREIKENISTLVDELISDVNAIIAQHPYLDIKPSSFSWFFRDSQAKKLSGDLEEFKKRLMKLKKQPNIDVLNALIEWVIISIESSAIKGHKARSDTLKLFLNNLGGVFADGSFDDATVKNFGSSASLAALRKRNGEIQQYEEIRDLIRKAAECYNRLEKDFNETQKQLRSAFGKAASERDTYEAQVKDELSNLKRKIDQKRGVDQELRGRLMLLGQIEVDLAGCKDKLEHDRERKIILEPEIENLQKEIALIDEEINEEQRSLTSAIATFEAISQNHLSAIHRLDCDLETNHDKLTERTAAKTNLEAAKKSEKSELEDKRQSLKKSNELSAELKPVLTRQPVQEEQKGTEVITSAKTTPRSRNHTMRENISMRLGAMRGQSDVLLPEVVQKKEDAIEQQQILGQKNAVIKKVQQEAIADEPKKKSTGLHRFFSAVGAAVTLDNVSATIHPVELRPEPLSFKTT